MELIVRSVVLADRLRAALREGPRAFPLGCTPGPAQARVPVLLGRAPQDPRPGADGGRPFLLTCTPAPYRIGRPGSWTYLARDRQGLPAGSGTLWLGTGPEAGSITGVVCWDGTIQPLTAIRLLGPGLERIPALDFPDRRRPTPAEYERWSRHAGALDEATWLRQRSLRVAVVGIGRTGSAAAATLARWGSHLTLVDPDGLEPHNLDGELYLAADCGRFKAEAAADVLGRLGAGTVDPVVEPVEGPEGMEALANCEVVVSCVDNDAARGFVGLWARRFGLVLLDVGTGVFRSNGAWRAGADLRLVIPGEGCLDCWGGLADADASPQASDWRAQRAGSLRTLNLASANLGLTMLEQYLAGRLRGSAWLRLAIGTDGLPHWRQMERAQGVCSGCLDTLRGRD